MNLDKDYLQAVRRILLALCRGFIKRGVTLPVIVNIFKHAIVQSAIEQSKQNKIITNSRISLMTGVHRKDVSAIRKTGYATSLPKSLNARVLAQWMGNPRFIRVDGSPRILKRIGKNSFEDLVVSVSKDIRPKTLLDEWLNRGIVSIDDNNEITLNIENYILSGSEEERLYFFGANLSDHIAVSTHNVFNEENPLFERASYADGLSSESIAKLQSIVNDRAMTLIADINKIAFKMVKKDKSKKGSKYRYKFGAYFYQSNIENLNPDNIDREKNKDDRKNSDIF